MPLWDFWLFLIYFNETSLIPRLLWIFRNMINFYGEELLEPRLTPQLKDHLLSAIRDCLSNRIQ